ncbi:MAG: thermonuclease family protein [Rhodobiaceae bacterium]|nr:thermonuclease family protein [Rhodobiaceae bacterium]
MKSHAGNIARDRMVRIAQDKIVTCRVTDRDRYGRTVARCTLPSGRDIGYELITDGFAREYCHFSRNFYGTCG